MSHFEYVCDVNKWKDYGCVCVALHDSIEIAKGCAAVVCACPQDKDMAVWDLYQFITSDELV